MALALRFSFYLSPILLLRYHFYLRQGVMGYKTIDIAQLATHFDSASRARKLAQRWNELKTYSYDSNRGRGETFVVDTPPPTVSGSLHIGHVFSYTHTDLIVRYKRMRGFNTFYPMGWDDNGLPTERR